MTPEEILLKAADDIATNGHYKGNYFAGGDRANGPACALGAIDRATYGRGLRTDFHPSPLLASALHLLAKEIGVSNIADWNDAPETTAEDVILAMKRAAHGDA